MTTAMRLHTVRIDPNSEEKLACTLCVGGTIHTFKNEKSLRSHHNKYHPSAGTLVFVVKAGVTQKTPEDVATTIAEEPKAPAGQPTAHPVLQRLIAKLDLDFFQDCDPTPNGKLATQNMHETDARNIGSDHDLEAALPMRRQEMGAFDQELSIDKERDNRDLVESGRAEMGGDGPEQLTSSRNPVLQNMIAKLDLAFFQDCDPTPHGKFSYQKVTEKITGKSSKTANSLLNRIFNCQEFLTSELKNSVEYFSYPGRAGPKTPVGTPLEILRYAALLPGPEGDAIRAAQADIAVRFRAGDHDLEDATRHMRSTTSSIDQEALLQGLSSSSDAQQKRQLDVDVEGEAGTDTGPQEPKRRKLEYTTAQLMEVGAHVCPGTQLLPIVIESFWEATDHDMSAFMARCAQMMELQKNQMAFQNSQMAFLAEEKRKQALHEADTERKQALHEAETERKQALHEAETERKQALYEADTERKQALHVAEFARAAALGDAVLTNEKARGQYIRAAEMERARLEAGKKNELADQEVSDRKTKAEKRGQKTGARKLAIPDVRRLKEAHFGDALTARCGHQPCTNHVNAAKGWIVAKDNYTAGMVDLQSHATVVCPAHAKDSLEPVRHQYSLNPRLVEIWLYRVGSGTSCTKCGICGTCPLRLWGDVELCHMSPSALGGSDDADNLILGSPACNRQQGGEDMRAFSLRISSSAENAQQLQHRLYQKAQLSAARLELMSCSARKVCRDAVKRLNACMGRIKALGVFRQAPPPGPVV